MAKFKKQEISEEDIEKVKKELSEKGMEVDDTEDDEEDDEEEKKDKKEFDEKCKDKIKEHLIQKTALEEIKKIIPEGVSQEFVESFETIIVGLVNEMIMKVGDSVIADVLEEMDNEIDALGETHKTFIESFLSVELEKFKESNKENIVSNIKLEKAEKFLNAIKGIFSENHFVLDDEKLSQVTQAEDKITQLETELNSNYSIINNLKKIINEKEIALEMTVLTSDLSELNKSRLVKMLEGHKELDSANYIKEAQKVKDFLITESVVPKKALEIGRAHV